MKNLSAVLLTLLVYQTMAQAAMAETSISQLNAEYEDLMLLIDTEIDDLGSNGSDWTFYLAPLLNGCDVLNVPKILPDRYTYAVYGTNHVDNNDRISTTYLLKDAAAFGYPLDKVSYVEGSEHTSITLTFKDQSAMSLRPKFELPNNISEDDMFKNNNKGYSIYNGVYTNLTFDESQKSVTCIWSV